MTPEACCQRRWSDHAELVKDGTIAQLRKQNDEFILSLSKVELEGVESVRL